MTDLLLTDENWDIVINGNNDIATTDKEYAVAQEVCNEIKLFYGEAWYDRSQGLPHYTRILGQSFTPEINTILTNCALSVDNVDQAWAAFEYDKNTKKLGGKLLVVVNKQGLKIDL